MLGIISEPTLDTDEKFCACFIYLQKEFDCANRYKTMQILKKSGID
jgi:hypothetical protein